MNISPKNRIFLIATVIILILLSIWWFTKPSSSNRRMRTGSVYSVKVTHPIIKPMPVTLEEVGNIEAQQSVNIIPQVSGILEKINLKEGDLVKKGALLFEIDPSVYATDVTQAEANLKRDQAELSLLKATANRYDALAKLEYVTQQQNEEAQAAVAEQAAVVSASTALLQQKKLQLSYTKIYSPIDGKAGSITVHVGDLITANSTTPLVVINKLRNVLVDFNINQDRLKELLTYKRAGTLKVDVMDEAGKKILANGELSFISNVVSGETGTVQIKATVPNPHFILWPGQLVTARLTLTVEDKALVIPNSSVQLGQKGHYVYVVRDQKAIIQNIEVARTVGNETVIADGLTLEDTIISEIPPGLQDGSSVRIEENPS